MLQRTLMSNGKTRVTFRLPDHSRERVVSVVGSFNEWTPGRHILVGRKDGTSSVTVTLDGGAHRFRYLGPDADWFDDPEADHLDHQGGTIVL